LSSSFANDRTFDFQNRLKATTGDAGAWVAHFCRDLAMKLREGFELVRESTKTFEVRLTALKYVTRDGVEPPTPALSRKLFFNRISGLLVTFLPWTSISAHEPSFPGTPQDGDRQD
jgi:hypothetical protein